MLTVVPPPPTGPEQPTGTRRRRGKPAVAVAPADAQAIIPDDLVTIDLCPFVFGLTRKAVEGKIARGQWVLGRQYHRDPQGGIWISRKGVRAWVVGAAG